jgi:hypothetical protein
MFDWLIFESFHTPTDPARGSVRINRGDHDGPQRTGEGAVNRQLITGPGHYEESLWIGAPGTGQWVTLAWGEAVLLLLAAVMYPHYR